jgi:predicted nucleotidyltransferase
VNDSVRSTVLAFVERELPDATTVIVGGSAAAGRRTATSDIDLLVLAPSASFENGGSVARLAHERGERLDVFGYTTEGFREWCERDFASLRPVLPFLLVEGTALREDATTGDLREEAAARLARGPSLTQHQLDLRRYLVTDLADDLADATEPFTIDVLRAELVRDLAQFLLLAANRWLGSGKWLVRRLRAWDPGIADELARLLREPDARRVAEGALDLLRPHGGRMDRDFVR